ncbi:glycosyl transferase [Ignatzschineria ureiclastica]|uniref:Glycosyl transferase n=2 Tax=Ignatzschineria ureiclastica TaxID=472582 RepID=A0A2U2AHM5_9GAMM|nr:glycosyl transferase [Ignatzschineria ureiclastica]
MHQFPGSRTIAFLFPTIAASWLLVIATLFFLRADYARSILAMSYIFANLWAICGFFIGRRYYTTKLALLPFGNISELKAHPHINTNVLKVPNLENRRYDAVVADLQSEIPAEWLKFLAECTLARIPVYDAKQLTERVTGRVKLNTLSENIYGVLYPSPIYELVKRWIEFLAVLITAPLWLPIMLITGIIIKLESPGSMFFTQNRVGLGNQDFTVYKLRSMCQNSEKEGAQFAKANDMRITRVGKFIRKTRIDEIPQFLNVLKGDMSLIGPRPEQRTFVEQFEKEISFYAYRHVVRPGITGWAQVTQGYAADTDETRIKLEHDFYYIKHFSLWLDILIVFKTIKTMLTGFGAR